MSNYEWEKSLLGLTVGYRSVIFSSDKTSYKVLSIEITIDRYRVSKINNSTVSFNRDEKERILNVNTSSVYRHS